MDAQELRNLQEAYMEVYEEKGDIKDRDEKASKQKADARMSGTKEITVYQSSAGYISKDEGEQRLNTVKKKINKELEKRKEKVRNRNLTFSRTKGDDALKMGKSPRNQKEQADLYDIILSHLLDEGYAETVEAAEAIMVNMSEEWRESICEELTGERKKRALEKGTPLANRVARAKEGQPRERTGPPYLGATKKAPIKRGGIGDRGRGKSEWTGYESDRGSGNKAARRAGIKVRDTSDEV